MKDRYKNKIVTIRLPEKIVEKLNEKIDGITVLSINHLVLTVLTEWLENNK